MKIMACKKFGGPDVLEMMESEKPIIQDDELLIRIKAAGVNPVDCALRAGLGKDLLHHQFPLTLGWDGSGVVEEVGKKTAKFSVGDEVYFYYRKPTMFLGTYAEYLAVPEIFLELKPKNFSFIEAAVVPLATLTVAQLLYEWAKLMPNQIVLVHAAAGGVGSFAVQMAKCQGATVLGTASAKNRDYVKSLGVDIVIDYTACDFRDVVLSFFPEGIDLVFDAVGGEVFAKSVSVLKMGGKLWAEGAGKIVTSVRSPIQNELMWQEGVNWHYTSVRPDHRQLAAITQLIENHKIKPPHITTFPLHEAQKAHAMIATQHTQGKIALVVSN